MSTTTTRAQDLRTVIAYGKRTDAQRLAFAAAAHRIIAGGTSQADLVREIKATDPSSLVSTKTLSLALKAYRATLTAADGDTDAVTAEGYGEAFRAVNSASAESGRGNAGGERKPKADTPTAPATLDDVLTAIAAITAFASQQDATVRQTIADAMFDASESLNTTVVLIATPVAA